MKKEALKFWYCVRAYSPIALLFLWLFIQGSFLLLRILYTWLLSVITDSLYWAPSSYCGFFILGSFQLLRRFTTWLILKCTSLFNSDWPVLSNISLSLMVDSRDYRKLFNLGLCSRVMYILRWTEMGLTSIT